MPVNGTRVTTLYAYALPGKVESFSAKTAFTPDVVTTTHHQLRHWRSCRGIAFLLLWRLFQCS